MASPLRTTANLIATTLRESELIKAVNQRTGGTKSERAISLTVVGLLPTALAFELIVNVVHHRIYAQPCTSAALHLSGNGVGASCSAAFPLLADLPSLVGAILALSMFVLYLRLSLILRRIGPILYDLPTLMDDRGQPGPPLLRDLPGVEKFSTKQIALSWRSTGGQSKPRRRLLLLVASMTFGLGAYVLMFLTQRYFNLIGGRGQARVLRQAWWANFAAAPWGTISAILWIVCLSLAVYFGLDNFQATGRVRVVLMNALDPSTQTSTQAFARAIPFAPNLGFSDLPWLAPLHLVGEMQYGAITILSTLAALSVIFVGPSTFAELMIVTAVIIFASAFFTRRFTELRKRITAAVDIVTKHELRYRMELRDQAIARQEWNAALIWQQQADSVIARGSLPGLRASTVIARSSAFFVGAVTLALSVIQAFGS